MKRGGSLARRTPLRAKGGFRKRKKPLNKVSREPVAKAKVRIQARIREIVIARDGGCVLRHYPEAGPCGWSRADGQLILQAEHLNGRSASLTYGDTRNIVCLCVQHHFYLKPRKPALYWDLVQRHIGPERWAFVQAAIRDRSPHKVHWPTVAEALERELETYRKL